MSDKVKLDMSLLDVASDNDAFIKPIEIESVASFIVKTETKLEDTPKDNKQDKVEDSIIEPEEVEDIASLLKKEKAQEQEDQEDTTEVEEVVTSKTTDAKVKEDPFKVFGEIAADKGLIDFNEEDFNKAEDKEEYLFNSVATKIADGIEDYKSRTFDDDIKTLIELREQGIPLWKALEADKEIAEYDSLKPEDIKNDESLQKSLLRDLFSAKGYDKDNIDKRIKRLETSGILVEEAEEAHTELLKIVKSQKEQMIQDEKKKALDNERNYNERVDALKKAIKDTQEILPGIRLTPEQRKQVETGILSVDKNNQNKIAQVKKSNPNFDLQVAVIATVFNGDFKAYAEALDRSAITKSVKKLKNVIDNDSEKTKGDVGDVAVLRKVNKDALRGAIKFLRKNS